ncbi:hypothetical protein [Lonsdalea britannica]|uniref:hypothetical protein n=1 Tax=Lonsdalea britannica TaxID=1082704 RepID=UPI001593A266|nr:hypothetical protein [Lonsdalea britannica]
MSEGNGVGVFADARPLSTFGPADPCFQLTRTRVMACVSGGGFPRASFTGLTVII